MCVFLHHWRCHVHQARTNDHTIRGTSKRHPGSNRQPARIPKSELLFSKLSKLSKLSIQFQGGVVFDWKRGLDVEAPNNEVLDLIVCLWSKLPVLPYKPGDRIRLVAMGDDPDPIEPGATGTITGIRNMGEWLQIDVQWDNGRSVMLSVPPDGVERLSLPEPDA